MNSAIKKRGYKILKRIALGIFLAGSLSAPEILAADAIPRTPDLPPLEVVATQDTKTRTNTILAETALRSGLTGLALSFTDDILKDDSNASPEQRDAARLIRTSALIDCGNFVEAKKVLNEIKRESAEKTLCRVWIEIGTSNFWEAGEIIRQISPNELSNGDAVWLELAQNIITKQSGDAADDIFKRTIQKGISPAQRSQFEYIQCWANATFVPRLSDSQIASLRENVGRAKGTREGAHLAKLLAIALNRRARDAEDTVQAPATQSEAQKMRAEGRKALLSAGNIPPDLQAEFDFLDGVLQDSESSVATRRAFMRVIRRRPDPALQEAAIHGLYRHVGSLIQNGNRDAAIIAAGEINDFFEEAQVNAAALPAETGKKDKEQKLMPDPRVLDLELFLRARISELVNDDLRTEKLAEELLEKCPNSPLVPDTLRLLISEAKDRREYRRAVPYLEKLRDGEPSEQGKAKISIILADFHFLSGDYLLAEDVYSRTKLEEHAGVIFFQRILCEIRLGKIELAQELIEAQKKLPASFDRKWIYQAECNLIEHLRQIGNLDEAAAQCKRFLEQKDVPAPYTIRVLWAQAQIAIEQSTSEIAISASDEINRILESIDPEKISLPKSVDTLKADTHLLKARALLRNGELTAAREQFDALRKEFPKSNAAVISYLDEGRALAEKSLPFDALACFERLIEYCERAPAFSDYAPVAYFEAAQQEVSLGRTREAIDRLGILLKKHGNERLEETIRMRQADLFRLLNDFESAYAIYDQLYSFYNQAEKLPEHVNLERIGIARADCLLAHASGIRKSDDATTRATLQETMRKAIAGYERICTTSGSSVEICAEAGNKWGYATAEFIRLLENPSESTKQQANLDARKIYWNVINSVINRASKGGVDPSENWGVSTGYWLARSLFAIADLCEEAGDYAEARKAYEQVKNWSARGWMPGSEYARSREEAIRDK